MRRPPPWSTPTDPGRRPLRQRTWALRRLLSACLAAAAVAVALLALSPSTPAGASTVVASHDLSAGSVLGADDVQVVTRTAAELPNGALTAVAQTAGRVLASAARRGEVLTDVRLVGPGLVDGLRPGEVAVPVRIADEAAAALVGPGDLVDVLVAGGDQPSADTVVRAAIVLARPAMTETGGAFGATADSGLGGLLVLGVSGDDARALTAAAARGPLSITLRPT